MFDISPLDQNLKNQIQDKIDFKTKPLGALGQLENLAMQLAMIGGEQKITLNRPTMIVFAADHGIAREGVSIAPPEVTQQMVANFLNGGAAVNCFCEVNQLELEIVDAGMLASIAHPKLTLQSLGRGTENFVTAMAMSKESVEKGISLGAKVVYRHAVAGCNVLAFGEMGIGNTSSASALLSAFAQLSADETVGRGTGISDEIYAKKVNLIQSALAFHQPNLNSPIDILACLGGFEIVQMTGAMLAAAECESVILVDGFIASIAALAATRLNPLVREYMVFCHRSEEQAHRHILNLLQAKPLLDLGLRLGEGTGAALAMPLLRAAEKFYNDMASFESAGVTQV